MENRPSQSTAARLVAFYLPQYHPIPENDAWWEPGFTEWTNTAKAKPLFRGHYQPHVPRDLGFYDLRCSETRIAQADLARKHGIGAFCYYHYWFAGRRLLQRPFQEVLSSGAPDFPFCLCWANGSWTGIWHGAPERVLIEQTYPGVEDYKQHFASLMKAFQDSRYFRVDGKPMFLVYAPGDLPDALGFSTIWRSLALQSGLPGLFLVGISHDDGWNPVASGFDASMLQKLPQRKSRVPWRYPLRKISTLISGDRLSIYDHKDIVRSFVRSGNALPFEEFPCVIPNWDNTPRSKLGGLVLHASSPELFRKQLRLGLARVSRLDPNHRLVFIKSWNEWAEGNHLEPDHMFGLRYLEVINEEANLTRGNAVG